MNIPIPLYQNSLKYRIAIIVILFHAIVGINGLFAQTSCTTQVDKTFNLSSTIQPCITYSARDKIVMSDGFHYLPTSTDTKFNANINQNLVLNTSYTPIASVPDAANRTLDKALPVGAIGGSFNVSPSGGATYSIPIQVSPGTAGVEPQISVSYNSQGGNSILGVGWDIAGLSAITRTPKNFFNDNSGGGVNFDFDDRFSLDGNRLILATGEYGHSGSTYGTETETFATITANGSTGNGPQWFKVETRDRKVLEYGYTPDSRVEASGFYCEMYWRLNKITDANGNYILYSYKESNGESYIDKIEYTGNTGLDPYNSVEFFYEKRNDPKISYVSAKPIPQTVLLYAIKVKNEGNLVREYNFKYTQDVYSQLIQVDEYNSKREQLNSTMINWGAINHSMGENSFSLATDYEYGVADKDKYWTSADINGDGLSDLIAAFNYNRVTDVITPSTVFQAYLAVPSSTGTPTFTGATYTNEYPQSIDLGRIKAINSSVTFANFTGNSQVDIILPIYDGNSLKFQNLYHSSQSPVIPVQTVSDFPCYGIQDLNNDGLDDIVTIEKTKVGSYYPGKVMYVSQDGAHNTTVDFNLTLNYDPENIIIADFNNDGLKDVMVVTKGNYSIFRNINGTISTTPVLTLTNIQSNYSCIRTGDFNGDGLIDFIVNGPNNTNWTLHINNGNFFDLYPISGITAYNDKDTGKDDDKDNVIVTDFNNDGMSDVIIFDAEYHWVNGTFKRFTDYTAYWYQSTGTGLQLVTSAISTSEEDAYSKNFVCGDFNGDGSADVINLGYDCYFGTGITPPPAKWRMYSAFSANFEGGLVTKISNGLNHTTKVSYLPLSFPNSPSGKPFYTKGIPSNLFPVINLAGAALKCAWKVTTPDGVNPIASSANITEYAYENARVHMQGKGFLGFSKVTAKNDLISSKVETTAELDVTSCRPSKQTTLVSNIASTGTNLKSSETRFDTKIQGNKYITLATSSAEYDFLTTQNTVTTFTYEKDASGNFNGNVTSVFKDFGDSYSENTEYGDYTAQGKPQLTTVTRKHPDDISHPFVLKVYTAFDSKCNLVSKIDNFQSSEKQVFTDYSNFNSFGQPKKVTSVAANIPAITTNYIYENKGRYLESESGPLGIKSYQYEPAYGNLVSETGITGLKTTYTYDSWGDLTEKLLPDGNKTTYASAWATEGSPSGALYYSSSSTTGRPWSKTWYDNLGRVIREETVGYNGISIYNDTKYKTSGQTYQKTSYTGGTVTNQVTYSYLSFNGRLESESYLNGKSVGYSYSGKEVSTTTDGKTYTKKFDHWGNVLKVTEPAPGGTIDYKYNPNGKPSQIITPASSVTMTYDEVGNQKTLIDPDAGLMEYDYDALGRLTRQKIDVQSEYWMYYDDLGRLDYKKNNKNEKTTYEYYTSGSSIGLLKKETAPNNSSFTYEYDSYGRMLKSTRHIDASITDVEFQTHYDGAGNIDQVIYPGSYTVTKTYDNYGNLTTVGNGSTAIWTLNNLDASKMKYTLGNGQVTEKLFTNTGLLTSITTNKGSVYAQMNYYDFNPANGLLRSREDRRTGYGLKESFVYDDLYRLTNWDIAKNSTTTASYSLSYKTDKSGNIDTKSGIGGYDYNTTKLHAINNLTPAGDCPVSQNDQTIAYTDFNKISNIEESNYKLAFTYGSDQERIKTEMQYNNALTCTRYYAGLYEKKVIAGGNTLEYYYIPAGDGLAAVLIKTNGNAGELNYIHKDHQGSITCITDANGAIKEQYNYDPWGRYRNPTDWSFTNVAAPTVLSRGYTGHEHLAEFALINMNGRVYDPALGMFLSPDNFVSSAESSLAFNRYSYCLNNPLIYTDPTGDFPWLLVGTIVYGGLSGGMQSTFQNDNFWEGAWKGAAVAGVTAGLGYLSPILSNSLGVQGALGCGLTSGLIGFIGGGVSSLITTGEWNWNKALIAGLTAGLVGGIQGYDNAKELGLNPWTGTGWSASYAPTSTEECFDYSNYKGHTREQLENLACDELNIDPKDCGLSVLTDTNVPKGFSTGDDGIIYNDKTGEGAYGWTFRKFWAKSEVYISPKASSNSLLLRATLGHELTHAYINHNYYIWGWTISMHERSAYSVELKILEKYKLLDINAYIDAKVWLIGPNAGFFKYNPSFNPLKGGTVIVPPGYY